MNLYSLIHEPGIILYLSVMGETEEAEKGALAEHFGNESVLRWWPLSLLLSSGESQSAQWTEWQWREGYTHTFEPS